MARIVAKIDGEPMNTVADAVEQVGGIQEEYFFEGTATRYRLAGGATEYPVDGRWDIEPVDEQPFRTRMLVLRPADPADFNGTVIVEWNNVSAGENFLGGPGAARDTSRTDSRSPGCPLSSPASRGCRIIPRRWRGSRCPR